MTALIPQREQRSAERLKRRCRPCPLEPRQRGTKVSEFGFEPVEPLSLLGPLQLLVCAFHKVRIPGRVAARHLVRLG